MTNIILELEESSYFNGISSESRKRLASICKPVQLRKGGFLFHEEDRGTHMYLLSEGSVQLYKTSPEGKEIVLKIVKPGEVFAEVILFEKDGYPATAVSLSLGIVIEIPRQGILELLEQNNFRNDFIAMLMHRQRYLAEKVGYLSSFDVADRFRMFLREHFGENFEIACTLSKKEVATAIGTTPESLSRLLLRLKKEKILDWTEKEIIKATAEFWEPAH